MTDNSATLTQSHAPVAIIGFGAAGMNAAIALRNCGYKGTIDVFSDTETLPYSPILTSYYVAGEKEYEQCFPWLDAEVDELNLNLHCEQAVRHLDAQNHLIQTDGGAFSYSKCLIATGSRPLANGFPKDSGYEPLMLRSMDDAKTMKAAFEDDACKKVLVSGASMVALKILEAALAHELDTTLVGMNPNILDFNALPLVAKRMEEGLKGRGVKLRLGQTISSVGIVEDASSYKGRKLQVSFTNGETDLFDEICVAHGMACNLDFLDKGALNMGNAILVDDHMRSSDPDVYAAGDVAQALELVSGESAIVGIWKNAVNQGYLAGATIASELAGEPVDAIEAYKGSISTNTIAVDGMLFISGGTIDTSGSRKVEVREDDNMTLACIFDNDRLNAEGEPSIVGFNLACDADEAGGIAYDLGAMLTLRMENDLAK